VIDELDRSKRLRQLIESPHRSRIIATLTVNNRMPIHGAPINNRCRLLLAVQKRNLGVFFCVTQLLRTIETKSLWKIVTLTILSSGRLLFSDFLNVSFLQPTKSVCFDNVVVCSLCLYVCLLYMCVSVCLFLYVLCILCSFMGQVA